MSLACDSLDQFFDGELTEEETAEFRDHLATCERCQAVLLGRAQEEVIIFMGKERHVSPSATQTRGIGRKASRLGVGVLAPLLAAAVLVIWLLATRAPTPKPTSAPEQAISLLLAVEQRGATARSASAHAGDVLRLTARGRRHRAIWVYRGDRELVVACPGEPRCKANGEELSLALPMSVPGQYSMIALGASEPIIAPSGALDVMLKEATAAGASVEIQTIDIN